MAAPVYATPAQLGKVTGQPPPCDAEQLLEDASRDLDAFVLTAVYDVDSDGAPTDPDVAAAFARAVCELVKYRGPDGSSGGGWTTITAGSVSMSRAAPDPVMTGDDLPPASWRALRVLPREKFWAGHPLMGGAGW